MADRLLAGVANRMVEASLRKLGNLIREGQDAEDRQKEPLRRRRRVYPDDGERSLPTVVRCPEVGRFGAGAEACVSAVFEHFLLRSRYIEYLT
jgi:hypothetical protein